MNVYILDCKISWSFFIWSILFKVCVFSNILKECLVFKSDIPNRGYKIYNSRKEYKVKIQQVQLEPNIFQLVVR